MRLTETKYQTRREGKREKANRGERVRREGEREAPRDFGSATAGCYVTAPPALSPHGLSRLSPILHPADAAWFLPPPPSSHMPPHMAPLLSLPHSLLHPLIVPQGSHQPQLPKLSLCLSPSVFLSVCLSLSHFHQPLSSPSLSG